MLHGRRVVGWSWVEQALCSSRTAHCAVHDLMPAGSALSPAQSLRALVEQPQAEASLRLWLD